jgi:hypothetical protein
MVTDTGYQYTLSQEYIIEELFPALKVNIPIIGMPCPVRFLMTS